MYEVGLMKCATVVPRLFGLKCFLFDLAEFRYLIDSEDLSIT